MSDTLCSHCSPIDLYSLFTGPRYYAGTPTPNDVSADLGTLQHIRTSTNCPLCRLVSHLTSDLWDQLRKICDPSDVQCTLWPKRMDYGDEMHFKDPDTQDLQATQLEIQFFGLPHVSAETRHELRRYRPSNGIKLLSPDSVDPARPLMNGFPVTTMARSLELVKGWIEGCEEHHGETCRPDELHNEVTTNALKRLRAIDVSSRQVVEIDASATRFAALSYVWGSQGTEYARLAAELNIKRDGEVHLPDSVPKVIEDAISICGTLSVPCLWADLYCVDQVDLTRKAAEIDAMGHIYRSAHVTLVAGGAGKELLPAPGDQEKVPRQKIEEINGRKYITEASRIFYQLIGSEWIKRSWTYQEGHLSRRIAFFDGTGSDVSFMCGAGHWRESLHSGVYGQDMVVPGVDLSASGSHVLGGHGWLRSSDWSFEEYERMVLNYTRRRLSYESDKLAALAGCLRLLEERKGVAFVQGLPTADFHYALLWFGADGPRRKGFPSWSWAGWVTSMNVTHVVGPESEISARLEPDQNGVLSYRQPVENESATIELNGLILRRALEAPHAQNRCTQRFATLRLSSTLDALTIESEAARFFLEVIPNGDECDDEICRALEAGSDGLDTDREYTQPWECVYLRDQLGNRYRRMPSWLSRSPLFGVFLPRSLRGSQFAWMMRDGIELAKIVDIEVVEGGTSAEARRHVLCIGIDRSEGLAGRGRRMGMFCIPGEYWEKAGAEPLVVELW